MLCRAVLVGKALGGTHWCMARWHRWAKLLLPCGAAPHGVHPPVLRLLLGDKALAKAAHTDLCSQRWVLW